MLIMGVASPWWMRAINEGVSGLANSHDSNPTFSNSRGATNTGAALAEER
jgi:hypothetical protein